MPRFSKRLLESMNLTKKSWRWILNLKKKFLRLNIKSPIFCSDNLKCSSGYWLSTARFTSANSQSSLNSTTRIFWLCSQANPSSSSNTKFNASSVTKSKSKKPRFGPKKRGNFWQKSSAQKKMLKNGDRFLTNSFANLDLDFTDISKSVEKCGSITLTKTSRKINGHLKKILNCYKLLKLSTANGPMFLKSSKEKELSIWSRTDTIQSSKSIRKFTAKRAHIGSSLKLSRTSKRKLKKPKKSWTSLKENKKLEKTNNLLFAKRWISRTNLNWIGRYNWLLVAKRSTKPF